MTLKIEKSSDGESATLRLIGRIRSAYLEQLKVQIDAGKPGIILDLEEVTLVDVEVVRFLCACEAEGLELLHCSRYIREWMVREQDREG
jgi:anti-anti-sigma regulatory factor